MPNSATNNELSTSPVASAISIAKDLFSLIRDLALATFAALLLLFPVTFNEKLTAAGFEEGSFVGLKWKAKLEQSDTGLKEARVQINNLEQQLQATRSKLKEAEEKLNDPEFQKAVSKLDAQTTQVISEASKVEQNVSTIISQNAPLVERSPAARSDKWGVVFGGDKNPDGAEYEIGPVAEKYGIPNAQIFRDINGVYRSVSLADSPEEARLTLSAAKKRRNDAYIVRMSSWCPNQTQDNGFTACN